MDTYNQLYALNASKHDYHAACILHGNLTYLSARVSPVDNLGSSGKPHESSISSTLINSAERLQHPAVAVISNR